MAEPTKIRAQAAGEKTMVRLLMAHEMESGQRKDDAGLAVPAWHITQVVATLNGKPVLTMHCGPAVSKHPFLQFSLRGAKAGDRIGIDWVDTRGERRHDETVVS